MAIIQITLSFDDMNISAQVGDTVYYSFNANVLGGFGIAALSDTKKLGPIVDITGNNITLQYDDSLTSAPPANSFISFVKDKKINTTSLLGYYAEVQFVNDSTSKVELFSVGSEVSESSK